MRHERDVMAGTVFEHATEPAFVMDPDESSIVAANDAGCALLGYPRDELLATPISRIHPSEAAQLSRLLDRVLRDGGLLLAEAGTGTGKTLAYLFPAVELGRRVVVSTGTKNLQEQLLTKDIPILARALGRDLNVAVMKGRGNYLCLLRYRSFHQAGSFRRLDEVPLFRAVESWAEATGTGDRGEIADLPDSVDFWREMSAGSENCIGQSCSDFDTCWVTRMRQRALEADVVVVNHHLLCADLAVKESSFGAVIPEYDTLVVDEAHLLEDVATQYFGVQVSPHRVEDLCRDVERELRAARLDAPDVLAEVEAVRRRAEWFFKMLAGATGRRLRPGWMDDKLEEQRNGLLLRLEGLRTAVLAMAETALTHLPMSKAIAMEEEGRRGAGILRRLLDGRERVLNPVLLLVVVCHLSAAALVTLAAGAANDITLDNANNFLVVSIASGNNVTLNDTNALGLNTSTVSGNLVVTANGAVGDTGAVSVAGTTSLTAGTGVANSIILDSAANDFQGAVSVVSANNVTLVDANTLTIGTAAFEIFALAVVPHWRRGAHE